ncbi:ComF family protein [Flexivirga sp. ID2601S]|uniref:ComF family protein n=1 Tax=Flexivirga aerilata TaxID=1656889 RepID=A0A849AU37_9MICO|nr:phosphoribosyltransferase family protein [Flexivirga aerilata]NNG40232.1 ComF family protein [Flexivirga aerilata]
MGTVAALRAFAELVLPSCCAGCGAPVAPLCPACDQVVRTARRGRARPARPRPCPSGFPPTWSAVPYDGPVAAMLRAFKDAGRGDLAGPLSGLLRTAVAGAIAGDRQLRAALLEDRPVLVVPVPSRGASVRARGREPMSELARHAVAGTGLRVVPALRIGSLVAGAGVDQAGLGADARAVNVAGTMRVRRRAAVVPGSVCLVLDDIVTTGSTLAESARALRAAGARSVSAATVAATQRHTTSL